MEFDLNYATFVLFLVTTKKLHSDLESSHFSNFSATCHKFQIGERDDHRKSRNGHGKVMEKYFVKSVGTLFGKREWDKRC